MDTNTQGTPDADMVAKAHDAERRNMEVALARLGAMIDFGETLVALCDRVSAKVSSAPELGDRANQNLQNWPPISLLRSATTMSKERLITEIERWASQQAELAAQYQMLIENDKESKDADDKNEDQGT